MANEKIIDLDQLFVELGTLAEGDIAEDVVKAARTLLGDRDPSTITLSEFAAVIEALSIAYNAGWCARDEKG